MFKNIVIFIVFFFISSPLIASENVGEKIPKHDWSFDGVTGTFDRGSLQRGFKVYREVCSVCHSMRLLYYRDLIDIGFTEEQVKAIASEYTVIDGPNDEGDLYERQGRPSDRFVGPYRNDNEARLNNNGAYPPDLSVITKSKKDGADYIYNLLLGYTEPPDNLEMGDGMYYNKWVDGNQIAMPTPLYDDSVEYDDETNPTLEQLAEDVTTFLTWAAEPELEERKTLGIKVILFFVIFGILTFMLKRKLWKKIN